MVEMLETLETPIIGVLDAFNACGPFNFFSWNKAYSLFPPTMFSKREPEALRKQHRVFSIADYSGNGVSNNLLATFRTTYRDSVGPRRCVIDRFTWAIPFDTTGVAKSDIPTFVLENSWFTLMGFPYTMAPSLIYFHQVPFTSCMLKWTYCTASQGDFWDTYVSPRLNNLAVKELLKIPKEKRPAYFGELILQPNSIKYLSGFEKPENWTYYDHMIPIWAKQWKKFNPTVNDLHGWVC
jgi:hypothetical protein